MKRLVICYDGTWNAVNNPDEVTNVVRVAEAISSTASGGISQVVYYNAGVGSGGPIDRFMGGVFGAGLRSNVQRGLAFLSLNWEPAEPADDPAAVADEIYIFGFSRGAYTARALAGVIRAIGGIPKQASFEDLETIWNHYKRSKEDRIKHAKDIEGKIYAMPADKPIIKCVGVWDTVGSYGIPAGLGLGGLARLFTSWTRGFHDNEIGPHIEYGLHAMAIDERRRAFPATAWVTAKGEDRPGVEQVWFAGAHANVGGGYKHSGLSDLALIWMIARVADKTKLEFDQEYIQTHFWPCAACSLYRSYKGWLISSIRPYRRSIPKRTDAAGPKDPTSGAGRILNAKVHWSVKNRRGRLSLIDQDTYEEYKPANLPEDVEYATPTEYEENFIQICLANKEQKKRKTCALYGDLPETGPWWAWRARSRARRMRRLRETWKDITAVQG
jgi:uncharacterized protein (DUF2235 family)